TGNNSWRRNDQGSTAVWSSDASGLYSPTSSLGSYSARFHTYSASSGTQGSLDLYVNCSPAGTKQLMFDYINTSGTDNLVVLQSTDGGATFPTTLGTFNSNSGWTAQSINVTSTSATTVIRFRATSDYGLTDIGIDNLRIVLPCSGTPTAGTTNASGTTVCPTATVNFWLTGATLAGSLTYQWQSSPDNVTYTNIGGATSATYSGVPGTTKYYRCRVTCTPSGLSANSTPILITVSSAVTYATLPYAESFESWVSFCDSYELPTINWRSTPTTGNNSWRRNDQGTTAAWTSESYGLYNPTSSLGSYSARFHTYSTSSGTQGSLDLYVNCSPAGTKLFTFDYINTSGTDNLVVLQSTDGGATFPTTLGTFNSNSGWTAQSINVTSTSATTVIRFRATSDYGLTDIGIDNLRIVLPCSGTPTAGTASVTPTGFCGATNPTLTLSGYTVAGGITFQWQSSPNGSSWTNISGATTASYSAPPITATTYYRCVVTCTNSSLSANSTTAVVTAVPEPLPACLTYNSPANTATGICPINTRLAFSDTGDVCGAAKNYKLYFGTNNPPSNIHNGTLIGLVGFYDFVTLSPTTTYYWKVVPTNTTGDATGCPIYSFTTSANPGPNPCEALLGAGVVTVPSLPYASGAGTTNNGNDLTSANTMTCGGASYLNGMDNVYVFTPAASGKVTITLTKAGSEDASLMVYEGCPLTNTPCGANAGSCMSYSNGTSTSRSVNICVNAGTKYFVVLDCYPTPNFYAFTNLTISAPSGGSAPANDLPCNATALTLGVTSGGDNSCSGSASEGALGIPACWTAGLLNTVWYKFVTPASGKVNVRTNTGTLQNTQIALYSGSCAALTYAGQCNDDAISCGYSTNYNSEMILVGLTPGITYYVRVDGYQNAMGTFGIIAIDGNLSYPAMPSQDCSIPLPVCNANFNVGNPGYSAVGNVCDYDGSGNCTGGERSSVWYTINIANNGVLNFNIIPNDYNGIAGDETDYDWVLWRIVSGSQPITNCAQIQATGGDNEVACNYSYLGVTGTTPSGNSPIAYPGFDAAYEISPLVYTGERYLLNINNFTQSTSGFTIDLTSTGGGIIDYGAAPNTLFWTGATDNDWFKATNWAGCQVPSCTTDVYITPGPTNQPLIGSAGAQCRTMNITAGASLTLAAAQQLRICGNFINSGVFNADVTSKVLFDNVSANDTIAGNFSGTSRFGNLEINKASGATTVLLSNDIEVVGNINIATASSRLITSGVTITLTGNYTNSGMVTANNLSTLALNGVTQSLSGNLSGTSALGNISIANTTTNLNAALDMLGTFQLNSGVFNTGGNIHSVAGDFIVSGSYNTTSNSVVMNGNSTQSMNCAGVTFYNLTINNPSGSVTALAAVTISNILNLQQGLFRSTGAGLIAVTNTAVGAITRTSGHIFAATGSNFYRQVAASGNYLFPVGIDAIGTANYRYAEVNINSITGSSPSIYACFNPAAAVNSSGTWPTINSIILTDCGPNGYWILNPNNITTINYDLKLSLQGLGLSGAFDDLFTVCSRPNGSTSKSAWTGGGSIPTPGSPGRIYSSGYAIRTGVTSFSEKGVGVSDNPQPIELLDFKATPVHNQIELKWTVIPSPNDANYALERSTDSQHYTNIVTLPVKDAGQRNYEYSDKSVVLNQRYYYRLRMINQDGSFTYSHSVEAIITGETQQSLYIYPNPTHNSCTVSFSLTEDELVTIKLYNETGQLVWEKSQNRTAGSNEVEIPTTDFAAGTYHIQIFTPTWKATEQIIKVK
ncbi:MAG: T9SS type A sorting domain-containing protein, partial [Bacteroidia bacterium]|nr:T9SS type A sorting domain-containing protein [Bacteroidia bacterium]